MAQVENKGLDVHHESAVAADINGEAEYIGHEKATHEAAERGRAATDQYVPI
jgi:hypothetical protein